MSPLRVLRWSAVDLLVKWFSILQDSLAVRCEIAPSEYQKYSDLNPVGPYIDFSAGPPGPPGMTGLKVWNKCTKLKTL